MIKYKFKHYHYFVSHNFFSTQKFTFLESQKFCYYITFDNGIYVKNVHSNQFGFHPSLLPSFTLTHPYISYGQILDAMIIEMPESHLPVLLTKKFLNKKMPPEFYLFSLYIIHHFYKTYYECLHYKVAYFHKMKYDLKGHRKSHKVTFMFQNPLLLRYRFV